MARAIGVLGQLKDRSTVIGSLGPLGALRNVTVLRGPRVPATLSRHHFCPEAYDPEYSIRLHNQYCPPQDDPEETIGQNLLLSSPTTAEMQIHLSNAPS